MIFQYNGLNEYSSQNIRNRIIYFSNISNFNDPFDSDMRVAYRGTADSWRLYLRRQKYTEDKIEETIGFLNRFAAYCGNNTGILDFPAKLKQPRDNTFISCFSRIPDSILMWSHYASQHRGFVRGFQTETSENDKECLVIEKGQVLYDMKPDDGLLPIDDVEYSDRLPPVADGLTETDFIIRSIHTKYSDWSYEKEVRAFVSDKWVKSQQIRHPENSLKQIILGMRMPMEDQKNLLRSLLESGSQGVRVFQCMKSLERFAVDIVEMPDWKNLLTENGS